MTTVEFPDTETQKFLSPYTQWAQALPEITLTETDKQIKGRRLYTLLTDTGKKKGPYLEWLKITRLNEDTVGIELISTQVGVRWVFSCYTDSFKFKNTVLRKDMMASEFIYFEMFGYDFNSIKRVGTAWLMDPNDEGSYPVDTFFDNNIDGSIYLGGPRSRRRGRGDVINYEESDSEDENRRVDKKIKTSIHVLENDSGSDSDVGLSKLNRYKSSSGKTNTKKDTITKQPPLVFTASRPPVVAPKSLRESIEEPALHTLQPINKPRSESVVIPSLRTRLSELTNKENQQIQNGTKDKAALHLVINKAPPSFASVRSSIRGALDTPSLSSKKNDKPPSLLVSNTSTAPISSNSTEFVRLKKELKIKDLVLEKISLENCILKYETTLKESHSPSPYNTANYMFLPAVAIAPKVYLHPVQNKYTSETSSILELHTTETIDEQLNKQLTLLKHTHQQPHPQYLTFHTYHLTSTPFSHTYQLEFEPVSMSLAQFHTQYIKGKLINLELCCVIISQLLKGLEYLYETHGRINGVITLDSIVIDPQMRFLKFADLSHTLPIGAIVPSLELTRDHPNLTHPMIQRMKIVTVSNVLDLWEVGKVLHLFLKDKAYDPLVPLSDDLFKMFLQDDLDPLVLEKGIHLQELTQKLGLAKYQEKELRDYIQI